MVDLLDAEPSLGVEGAAAIVARGMQGKPKTHIERLRKKYRRNRGQLPKGGLQGRQEGRADAIREYLKTRKAEIDDAKRLLAGAEREAKSLGVDTGRQDLSEYIQELERRRESLEVPARWNPLFATSWFLDRGITDPEEVVARSIQAVEELELIEKQIEIVRKLRRLRDVANRPT